MNELITDKQNNLPEVSKHNFESKKKQLKEFSETPEKALTISHVETGGEWLGITKHNVTGAELNTRLEKIQNNFMTVNDSINKLIREFRTIYDTFDVLDNEYITAIVANVKAIEKTSDDVRKQQNKLDKHQDEIQGTVKNTKKIVDALKSFKTKLEKIEHISDIDKIWNEYNSFVKKLNNFEQTQKKELSSFSAASKKQETTISTLTNSLNEVKAQEDESRKLIEQLDNFNKKISALKHLLEVDEIWNNCEESKETIQKQQSELAAINTKSNKQTELINALSQNLDEAEKYAKESRELIAQLEDFREKISALNHLMDIDKIWEQSNNHQTRIDEIVQDSKTHTDKLNALEQDKNAIYETINENTQDINNLKGYTSSLQGISHLNDVDTIWQNVEGHTSQLIAQGKKNAELTAAIQKNKEESSKDIAKAVQTTNEAIESLTKKTKYAFGVAGGAAILAVVELILLLM